MILDYLDRYIWEAEAHANELLEMYCHQERLEILVLLDGHWEYLLPHLRAPSKTAFVFLGEGPTAQEKRIQKLKQDEAWILWSQARFLALQAARSMRLAATVADVKGLPYRKAVRKAAQASSQFPAPPEPGDIALLRLPE